MSMKRVEEIKEYLEECSDNEELVFLQPYFQELFEMVEKLEEEKQELNREIGRYANKVWDMSELNSKLSYEAKQLINSMVGNANDH